jgi:hypothetical protein
VSRHEESVYRTTRKSGEPSLKEMKSQAARLKQDLEQFQGRGAGAALIMPLRERIRDLEAAIAHAEARKAAPPRDPDDPAAPRVIVQATSSRFPPRGPPGRG